MLLFSRAGRLRSLAAASTWFMNGHSAKASIQFKQLFIVGVLLCQTPVSVACALVPSKRGSVYSEIFCALREECLDLHLVPKAQNLAADSRGGFTRLLRMYVGEIFVYAN